MSPDERDPKDGMNSLPTLVLAFHKLLDRFSFSSTNYSPARLVTLLERLCDAGFAFNTGTGSTNSRQVLVTFDDGYRHLIDLLPKLVDRFNLHPIVFMPTAYIGKENSWDYSHWFLNTPHLNKQEIRDLSEVGVKFGSHGHSHVSLKGLSTGQVEQELRYSKKILEDICGVEVNTLSYPFGRTSDRIARMASEIGYDHGFTMQFPSESDEPLSRGRFAVYGFDTSFTLLQRMNKGPLYPLERAKARFANLLSGGTVLYHRLSGRGEASNSPDSRFR